MTTLKLNKATPKPETNIEFLTRVMSVSQYGALVQGFVMHSIQKEADRYAAMDPKELAQVWGKGSFIQPEAWIGIAKELSQKFKERP